MLDKSSILRRYRYAFFKCFGNRVKADLPTSVRPRQSEGGSPELIFKHPWLRCLQGAADARWIVVCCCCRRLRRPTGGSFWTNRAEAHGQLVLSPMRLPEQLRTSR